MARLSPKQRLSIREATTSVNIWNGSIRSGKTIASLLAFLAWLPEAPPGPVAIIGKTRDTILRNILEVIRQLHPDAISPWAKTATVVTIMGREVHLIGVNDARSEEKVRGLTLAGAYVDEITLLQRAFFVQLLGRLSVSGARLFGTTNPDSPQHWFKVDYLNRADVLGWNVWHFTMADNPGLTDEYKAAKAAEFTGLFYQRFILGLWVAAEGAIYGDWDPATHVVPWAGLPRITRYVGVGVDYGTTNPTVAILLGLGADGVWYAVDEWAHTPATSGRKATDAELSAGLRAWLTTTHTPEPGPPTLGKVYIDPAAASFREQLKRDGLPTVPANNDVLPGIQRVASLLAADRLKVSDRCRTLISEFPGYVWDTKATDKGEDKPVKLNDHACFVAGTMVETDCGPRAIETIRPGDRVWTRNGLHAVMDAGMTSERADVMTVTLSNGAAITGTENHPVWVQTRGWVTIGALRYGDKLEAWTPLRSRPSSTRASSSADTRTRHTSRIASRRGVATRGWTTLTARAPAAAPRSRSTGTRNRSTAPVRVLHVARESEPRSVYNIAVSNAPEYYAGGVLVHNCDALRYVVAATARYTIT